MKNIIIVCMLMTIAMNILIIRENLSMYRYYKRVNKKLGEE